MGDASISAERATLICHHNGEGDVKVSLENVHIEVVAPTRTISDSMGEYTIVEGFPRVTISAALKSCGETPFGIDPKHPPKPALFVPGRKRRKKDSMLIRFEHTTRWTY